MDKSDRRRMAALLLMSVTTLFTATRSPGFDNIRIVLVALLMSSGMCAGVALSLFLQGRKASRERSAES